jgi:hypothetical protein
MFTALFKVCDWTYASSSRSQLVFEGLETLSQLTSSSDTWCWMVSLSSFTSDCHDILCLFWTCSALANQL